MVPLNPLQRLQLWLAVTLGDRYATVISIVERVAVVFASAFAAKAIASGLFSISGFTNLSYWQTAAGAGVAAALVALQSIITAAVTGTPDSASFVSQTVRAHRELGARVEHRVPLRPARRTARRHRVSRREQHTAPLP